MEKSEQINELAAALAKAQGQMEAATKDSANPFFKSKYADLAAIVAAIKKPLADNGLAYVQLVDHAEGGVMVETVLMHSSGQWISSRLKMPVVKSDSQGVGSAITYGRRYGLQAMVGIPADDDDGNAAAGHKPGKERTVKERVLGEELENANAAAHLRNIVNKYKAQAQEEGWYGELERAAVDIAKTRGWNKEPQA